jgi:hypothetical protein
MKKLTLGFLALVCACGNTDFDPQSKVDSVRILSARADKPYAKPGEVVTLDLLAVDGRVTKARPMRVAWIPLPCVNPPEDLYFLCFASAGGMGAPGTGTPGTPGTPGMGGGLPFQPGQDITDVLPAGNTLKFTMPANAIIPRPRAKSPYGLVIYFNIACAGRIRIDGIDPAKGQQQIPFYCSDEQGVRLPPSEYVVGFTRVYSYEARINNNPSITSLRFQGEPVNLKTGITVDRCLTQGTEKKQCPELKLDVQVPDESYELNEGEVRSDGSPAREIVWSAFYSTAATFEGDARLMFDATTGRVPDSAIRVYPAANPQSGLLWVVTKDNRGGTAWEELPFTVK